MSRRARRRAEAIASKWYQAIPEDEDLDPDDPDYGDASHGCGEGKEDELEQQP